MGTITVNKLGGLSLILGPVFTLIFYFLQPGGALIDAADPANAQASIAATLSNAGLAQLTGVLIPIGLLVMLAGILSLQRHVSSGGNGDALARYGVLFIFVACLGWILGTGMGLAISGSDLPVAKAVPTFGSLYAAITGIGTVAGIFAGIGFLALSLAISTRDDYSKPFALVAAAAAVVQIVVGVIGGVDSTQLQTMTTITGIVYLIHTAFMITVGLKLMKQ